MTPTGTGQWLALSDDRLLVAWLRVDSQLRAGARDMVDELKARGLSLVLASGDRTENVAAMARHLDIEDYHGDMSPDDKLALVRRRSEERRVGEGGRSRGEERRSAGQGGGRLRSG